MASRPRILPQGYGPAKRYGRLMVEADTAGGPPNIDSSIIILAAECKSHLARPISSKTELTYFELGYIDALAD